MSVKYIHKTIVVFSLREKCTFIQSNCLNFSPMAINCMRYLLYTFQIYYKVIILFCFVIVDILYIVALKFRNEMSDA